MDKEPLSGYQPRREPLGSQGPSHEEMIINAILEQEDLNILHKLLSSKNTDSQAEADTN